MTSQIRPFLVTKPVTKVKLVGSQAGLGSPGLGLNDGKLARASLRPSLSYFDRTSRRINGREELKLVARIHGN